MKTADGGVRRQTWWLLGAALFGLVLSTALAASRQFSGAEQDILWFIYDIPGPLQELMYAITQTGSLGAVLVVVGVTVVLKRRRLAALLLVNTSVALAITLTIKEWLERPRPAEVLSDIAVRLEYASGYGFPSGHVAITTVLAVTLMAYVPKSYRWLLWLWIVAVAMSRLYLGVHAPLDIVGGFCIGVLAAYGGRMLATRIAQK